METQGEYPHKVWIVWSSNMPEEGCRVLPESTGSTTAEVIDDANKRDGLIPYGVDEGYDRAELRWSALSAENLSKEENLTPFLGPVIKNEALEQP